ncbi:MAG: hypothetical protein AAB445_04180 [Patescibacteria group bacterium]
MITPVTPAKTQPDKKPEPWKFWVMGGLAVGFAVIFWWTLSLPLQHNIVGLPAWEQGAQFLIALVFFCVMLALFGVVAMAAKRKYFWVTAITALVCSLALVPFFPIRTATLGAAGFAFVGFLVWAWNVGGDVQSRIKFQPHYTIHAGFGTGIILILVGMSLCYYSTLGTSAQTAESVRTGLIGAARNGIDFYLPKQIPGYRGTMTLDQFLSLVATDKFGEFVVPQITQTLDTDAKKEEAYKQITEQLKKVNPVFDNPDVTDSVTKQLESNLDSQRTLLQQQVLAQLSAAQRALLDEARREFLATFKIEAQGSDTMDTVVEKILTRNVSKYVDPYEKIIPPILALSFFFIVEFISFAYRYIIFGFAPIITWLYRRFGLLHLSEKSATVQNLEV